MIEDVNTLRILHSEAAGTDGEPTVRGRASTHETADELMELIRGD